MFYQILPVISFALILIVLGADGKNLPDRILNRLDFKENDVTVNNATLTDVTVPKSNNPEKVLNFLAEYRKLRRTKSDVVMRIIGTVGLVSGALRVEEAMRDNLHSLADEWIASFNVSTPKENMEKLLAIEETIDRDKFTIEVLNSVLQYARNVKNIEDFHKDMQRISKENEVSTVKLRNKKLAIATDMSDEKNISTGKLMHRSGKSIKFEMTEKLNDVKEMIDKHIDDIHSSVTENAMQTIEFIKSLQKANEKLFEPNAKSRNKAIKLDPSLGGLEMLWDQVNDPSDVPISYHLAERSPIGSQSHKFTRTASDEQNENIRRIIRVEPKIDRFRRQEVMKFQRDSNKKNKPAFAIEIDFGHFDEAQSKQDDNENEVDGEKQSSKSQEAAAEDAEGEAEFDESSASESEEVGGLAGLIANLSGGDEGSDVGAIIGAATQVITNLLGPGGIDIPSIITSATGLLSSLLAGDENFGKILGNYAGLGIDGLSGGGGAANNGQFFGQFVGKFISVLSANPEDEDQPPQPGVFLQNLFDGVKKGASQKVDVEASESGRDVGTSPPKGSDSGAFIAHVITTIVAGIASGIANASLGSSGGSSTGSSTTSAQASHKPH